MVEIEFYVKQVILFFLEPIIYFQIFFLIWGMRCVRIANVATFILNAAYTCLSNSKIIWIQNLDTTQKALHMVECAYVLVICSLHSIKLYSTDKNNHISKNMESPVTKYSKNIWKSF